MPNGTHEKPFGDPGVCSPGAFARCNASPEYAVGDSVPGEVWSVTNEGQVEHAIRECGETSKALLVRGGGTELDLGNNPSRFDVLLSTESLNAVTELQPEDMVATVQAGLPLASLEERLASLGQRSGLSAWNPERATVGGLAATNTAALSSYGFGFPRDQILGLRVIDGAGRRLRAGGRVVKNVAGYDLPRLFIGSCGTLGVITELTVRTYPRPECSAWLGFDFEDSALLDDARERIFLSPLPLSGIHAVASAGDGRQPDWSLHVWREGTRLQADFLDGALSAICRQSPKGRDTPPELLLRDADDTLVCRLTVAPTEALSVARDWTDGAAAFAACFRATIDCAVAIVRLHVKQTEPGRIAALLDLASRIATRHGSRLVIERAPAAAKIGRDAWGGPVVGDEIMKRIKQRFDPGLILAPGRYAGGL